MDWFETLTGFREKDVGYSGVQERLEVTGDQLRSKVNGRGYGVGRLGMPSLRRLREEVAKTSPTPGKLSVRNITGDVRKLHRDPGLKGALFQVASQFNLLEMVEPGVTPEEGVAIYAHDRTQGPACAIAAGAATIFRNYFAPFADGVGQTGGRQLNALALVGEQLSDRLGLPVDRLWAMRNGYALGTHEGLAAISRYLNTASETEKDTLRAALQIGFHESVEVTEAATEPQFVSQAFCSALPVAYSKHARSRWEPFARIVLEAAYEATLHAALLNAQRTASNVAVLTFLGGGAFGNEDAWIEAAVRRALEKAGGYPLDVRILSYREPPQWAAALER